MLASITQASEMLGVPYWHIRYCVQKGIVPKPALVAGSYIFTSADLDALKQAIDRRTSEGRGYYRKAQE